MGFTIKHAIEINRPIHEVFDFHANIANTVYWHGHTIDANLISEIPTGLGATFEVLNQVGWITNTDTREIIEYDRPHTYTYRLTTRGSTGTSQQILEEKDGCTIFTVVGQMQLFGITRLFEPMIARQVDTHMAEALVELKTYLENH